VIVEDENPLQDIRKNPEEEYFKLSVLALKMDFNEKQPDFIFQISSKKLFKKC
jgi:hypothetical protein